VGFHKRAFAELARAPCCDVEHLHNRINSFGQRECRRHRFRCVLQQRIGRVDIKVDNLGHVGGDAAPREPRDIIKRVLESRKIVQVGKRAGAIQSAVDIKGIDRRTTCPKIDPIAADFDGSAGITPVQRKRLGSLVDHVFDQGLGKADARHPKINSANSNQIIPKPVWHIAHAQFRQ